MAPEGDHEAYRRQITETNVSGYYPSIMGRMTYVRRTAAYDFGPWCHGIYKSKYSWVQAQSHKLFYLPGGTRLIPLARTIVAVSRRKWKPIL